MQISDRVHLIPAEASLYTGPFPPNVWLVVDSGEAVLVDSGFAEEQAIAARLNYIGGLDGVRLKEIVLTHHHFDHSSGADTIRRSTGATLALHEDEEDFIKNPRDDAPDDMVIPDGEKELAEAAKGWREEARKAIPNRLLRDGDAIGVGSATLRVMHTPGHTLGSLCLYLDEEDAVFTGDTVLGRGTVAINPPPYGNMGSYLESLTKLEASGAELICPGHGPTVEEPAQKVRELIAHRHDRETQIVERVQAGRNTVGQLLKDIYPEVDRRLHSFATSQLLAHLHKLQDENLLELSGKGRETAIALK
ncbi:MAG: MBL fold metallo-hydrolase [Dehalococcoidia bacterium]|nr:MBL fold metallo-hydrolase [Dehalococcoidia bacterium]